MKATRLSLSLLKQEKPDLIITDIIMPNMDGFEFLFNGKNREHKFPCRIIAMSGGGRIGRNYCAAWVIASATSPIRTSTRASSAA